MQFTARRRSLQRLARYFLAVAGLASLLLVTPAVAMDDGVASTTVNTLLESGIPELLGVEQWPCLYTGQFEQQRTLPGSPVKLKSRGQFLYACEQGLLWEIQQPIAESLVYTYAQRHYQIRAEGQGRELRGAVQQRVAQLLLALLGGQVTALGTEFDAASDGAEPPLVTLSPRAQAMRQHLEKITLQTGARTLQVQIHARNKELTELLISQLVIPTRPPVVSCAAFSLHPQTACRRLFDPGTD